MSSLFVFLVAWISFGNVVAVRVSDEDGAAAASEVRQELTELGEVMAAEHTAHGKGAKGKPKKTKQLKKAMEVIKNDVDKAGRKTKPEAHPHHLHHTDPELVKSGHLKIISGTGRFAKGMDKDGNPPDHKEREALKKLKEADSHKPDGESIKKSIKRRNQKLHEALPDVPRESREAAITSKESEGESTAVEDERQDPASGDEAMDIGKLLTGKSQRVKRDEKIPFHRQQTNQTRLLHHIVQSQMPSRYGTGTKPLPELPGDNVGNVIDDDNANETVCNGWQSEDATRELYKMGSKCDYWGWSVKWCWVDKEHYIEEEPGNDEFMKHSAIFPGKYFAMCTEKDSNDTNSSNGTETGFAVKAQKLNDLSGAMRIFAKAVKYNASLKLAKAERAEYDLARIQEKASEIRKRARKEQRDADEEQEAAKVLAWQADFAAKKQINSLQDDMNKIKESEDEDALEAHNTRLNVTRAQAQAERARQQADLVNLQATEALKKAHQISSDASRKAEEANRLAQLAEEEAVRAEKDRLIAKQQIPATTTFLPDEDEKDNSITAFPGGEDETTTSTTTTVAVSPEALPVYETNWKKLKAAIAREDGFNLGRKWSEEAVREAEDLIRDALHMPTSNLLHADFDGQDTPMSINNRRQADQASIAIHGKNVHDMKKETDEQLRDAIINEQNVKEAVAAVAGNKGGYRATSEN
eukprot:TRINITY_DN75069_c0_g1_i1.p1 TRINITY_DN75069_c0_g1~~TRINITY_DN75069_c0_g1_i1.p1  ORF type:complete len:697 (+),score=254.19 TRINITY_DN75069_c0_g1_i1:85-2175(+)